MGFSFLTYLTVVFFTLAFLSLGVGSFINHAAQDGIKDTGMSGIEAFLYSNLVGIILVGMALGLFAFIYFGG